MIWLLVAVIWGTFRVRGATAQLPQEIFEQENAWTFGQIVPVLLLAVPIFATVIQFASDRNNNPGDQPRHDQPRGAPGAAGARKPYPFGTQTRDLPGALAGGYGPRSRWLWPSLAGLFVSAVCFTFQAFSHNFDFVQGLRPSESLVDVWFTRFGLLWYILLGLPCVFCSAVAIGLALDRWLGGPGGLAAGLKVVLYQLLVLSLVASFAGSWVVLVYYEFQAYLFEDLFMSEKAGDKILMHIITCISMVFLYYGVYLFVASSVSVFTRKEVNDSAC